MPNHSCSSGHATLPCHLFQMVPELAQGIRERELDYSVLPNPVPQTDKLSVHYFQALETKGGQRTKLELHPSTIPYLNAEGVLHWDGDS